MFPLLGASNLRATVKQGLQLARLGNVPQTLIPSFKNGGVKSFRSTNQPKSPAGLAQTPFPEDIVSGIIDNPFGIPFPADRSPSIPNRVSQSQERATQLPGNKATNSELTVEGAQAAVETDVDIHKLPIPAYFRGTKFDRVPYWQKIGRWQGIVEKKFLSYRWSTASDVQGKAKLYQFLNEVLPEKIPFNEKFTHILTRDDFIKDVMEGMDLAPMSIRIPPHILASVDWDNPIDDPLRLQFIPLKSAFQPDHPQLSLDSLHETADSPVEGLVHRYTDKCLFLASSHCPLYCRYCTRSYAVGANTETVKKATLKPKRARWEDMLNYIERTPVIQDVVISGGDSYSLQPQHLRLIGERLLSIPHIRRFRFASKGLCVSPSRILDPEDSWVEELVRLSKRGRERGVHVALHTHFNHVNEFSWVTREAAQRLFEDGVVVRNQSVLLRGVNDDAETMGALIRELADNNIQPYYVYAGDLVRGVEDLRTPLQTILDLEQQIRGSIAGFMTPQFVVDLPGGGGKRLASSYKSYDRKTGISKFVAPSVKGGGRVYEYFDPLHSLPKGEDGATSTC